MSSLFANMLTVFTLSGVISHNIRGTYASMFILLTCGAIPLHMLHILVYYINNLIGKFSNYLFEVWDSKMEELGRKMIIPDREGRNPYLIRYYMLYIDRDDNGGFPFNIFIHKFIIGDDADKHDHPWNFFTLILSGGYYEEYEENIEGEKVTLTKYRAPGFFQYVNSTHTHRVTLPENKGCWTLFIPLKKNREWGFWKKNPNSEEKIWMEAKQYLKEKRRV